MCCAFLAPAQDRTALEPVKTSITVVENITAETPANVTTLDTAAIRETPGVNLDDRLRDVPGFTLFRRTSSLVAHPTTQGISLRGIGSSGASRTLVLWDGIPANDPFGGWVYWTRFIPLDTGRIEISRGAATSVFGDRAMSGSIGLFSRPQERRHLTGEFVAGNRDSQDATLGFSQVWQGLSLSGTGRALRTDGYFIVPEQLRGAVDRRASLRFVTGDVRVARYSGWGNLYLKLDALAEDRQNGTALTHNSTSLGDVSLRYERAFAHDSVSLVGFHTREAFRSTFSSVSADRNTERLTFQQTVPAQATGGAAYWGHSESAWNLTAGADIQRASGTSTDRLIPTGFRIGGGSQLQHGLFAQANAKLGPARFFGGLRHSFTGQGGTFLSPSGGVSIERGRLRVRGSAYRAFRAPTLNELFRTFRAGNAETRANPDLLPETLSGQEAGADWTAEGYSLRVTAYRYSLHDLITNVTLSSTPAGIIRQRANAAAALSRGVEAQVERRLGNFSGELKYLFADSRYATGLRVAQIPKHQGSAQVVYSRNGATASLGVRTSAYQFDDDLNQFRLPGYAVVELLARQRVAASLSLEFAMDNALGRQFYTAFTPTPNIGQPRLWRVGVIWDGAL